MHEEDEQMSELDKSGLCCVIKDNYGAFVYTNETMSQIFGIPGGFAGRTDYHLMPDTDAANIRTNDKNVLMSGEQLETVETVHQNGAKRYFAVWKFRIMVNSIRFLGVFALLFDATDDELEKASKQAQKRLREEAEPLRPTLESLAGKFAYQERK